MYLLIVAFFFCMVIAIFCLFLYCRKIERKCNHCIAKSLRELDRMFKELERMQVERETIEKILKFKFCNKKTKSKQVKTKQSKEM